MYILRDPLAFIIRPIYDLIGNYGITLIVVTILVRLLTLPLTIKSQKNMSKTQLIQPQMAKLQNKYKNDRDTLAREMQKLYKQYDVNPLGGCLPLLLQMFVLFGFIGVIYNPLQCILQLDKDQLSELAKLAGAKRGMQDVNFCANPAVAEQIRNWDITPINFNLFGIDLSKIPSGKELTQWIFPALAFLATVASSLITKRQTSQNAANQQGAAMGNFMIWLMPAMTLMFIFSMPIAMSLYWFVSTVLQLVQQTVINGVIKNKIQAEMELKGKK